VNDEPFALTRSTSSTNLATSSLTRLHSSFVKGRSNPITTFASRPKANDSAATGEESTSTPTILNDLIIHSSTFNTRHRPNTVKQQQSTVELRPQTIGLWGGLPANCQPPT